MVQEDTWVVEFLLANDVDNLNPSSKLSAEPNSLSCELGINYMGDKDAL